MRPQQADGIFYQGDTEIGENLPFFIKRSAPENFQRENFSKGVTGLIYSILYIDIYHIWCGSTCLATYRSQLGVALSEQCELRYMS